MVYALSQSETGQKPHCARRKRDIWLSAYLCLGAQIDNEGSANEPTTEELMEAVAKDIAAVLDKLKNVETTENLELFSSGFLLQNILADA